MNTRSERLRRVFEQKKDDEKIMNLFLTAGYPSKEETAELILGFEKNGADIIELGMPFSDPLADGPTIQYASNVAIQHGTDLRTVFEILKEIRKKSEIPVVLMGYINPILAYGIDDFFADAATAGADGFILPDVPLEESEHVELACNRHNLDVIYLVAPNTSDARMQLIDKKSSGFVYCVSVTGVTGARSGDEVAQSVERFIDRVKSNVRQNPVLVGFGINCYEDAQQISRKTEGFVVGSALITKIRENYPKSGWKENVFSFVKELKYGKVTDQISS